MTGHVPSGVTSARPAPPRDFDGIFKALLDAHPRDALQLLCGATVRDGDRLDYHAVNIPDDFDPDTLLASTTPALALFTRKPPHDLVERVTDQIAATEKHEDKLLQTELGMLAGGAMATQLVEALRRRGMNNILEQTETGREIARTNREEGHVDLMRAALQAAHGDITDLDELARRLADHDHSGNIARIVAGATLDDLRA
jgi:hypothetical protein